MSPTSKQDADCHFGASTLAAVVNYPFWRASTIAQSGFKLEGSNAFVRYYRAVVRPPYKGIVATILGMSWARGAIFYGSDYSKEVLLKSEFDPTMASLLPPLMIGTFVQFVNMPLVRATITIQNPQSELKNTVEAIVHIYKTRGLGGLWHGVSAGVLKTVPKYMTAVGVKNYMEDKLPKVDPSEKTSMMLRSAVKSMSAGVAGAILTNPLDVIRNEMFKTDLSLGNTIKKLINETGWSFMTRGVSSNTTAVAVPIAVTIFFTDMFLTMKYSNSK